MMELEGIINESKELQDCLKVGYYERAFELARNIEDELIAIELKKLG